MLIELTNIDRNFDGGINEREGLSIEIPVMIPFMFTSRFIISKILEGQKENKLHTEWIDPDILKTNNHYHCYDEYLNDLTFTLYSGIGKNIARGINVCIIPETNEEFEMFFSILIDQRYQSAIKNATISLPKIFERKELIDPFMAKEVGDFLIIYAYEEFVNSFAFSKSSIDHLYIIRIKDLSKPIVRIYSEERLVPHLIGKGGKNIAGVKEMIHAAGYRQVRKIEIIPVKKENE